MEESVYSAKFFALGDWVSLVEESGASGNDLTRGDELPLGKI